MAKSVYRFQWEGVTAHKIENNIPKDVKFTISQVATKNLIDITLDPGDPGSAAALDLQEVMSDNGWTLIATNPQDPQ